MMKSTSSFDDGLLFKSKNDKKAERTTERRSQTPPPASLDAATERDDRASTSSPTTLRQPQPPPKILWSCIARDDIILAEANDVGRHDRNNVADAARQLLRQNCTPGFEYYTQHKTLLPGLMKNRWRGKKSGTATLVEPLKGIKFHVFEHISDESMRNLQLNDGADVSNNVDIDLADVTTTTTDAAAAQRESTPHLRVWVFAAIFDPSGTNRSDVQSFLEKIVHLTETLRTYDPEWQIAKTLGLQTSFAPTLQQRMEEVTYLGKIALLQQQVHACQEQMEHNIDLMLENTHRAQDLDEEASHLKDLCHVFQKKAKEVKRQHMLANAKYGLVAGTAATGLAAVVIVPLVVGL
jgi:hypothetical protein